VARNPHRKRTKRTFDNIARIRRKRPPPPKGQPRRSPSSEDLRAPPPPKKKRRPSLPRPLTYREQKGQRLVEFAEAGNERAVRDLLADGFTDHNFRDPTRDLKTALIVAVERDFRHVVRALLENPSVNRDIPDAFDKTALSYSTSPEVKLLLRDSAPLGTPPPPLGTPPLAASRKRKQPPAELEKDALMRENAMLWSRVARLQNEKELATKQTAELEDRLKVQKEKAFNASLAKSAVRTENAGLRRRVAALTTENDQLKEKERGPVEIRLPGGKTTGSSFPRILPNSITGLQTVARSALGLASTIQDRIAEIQRCSICVDRSCNSTLVPCGHMFCRECTNTLQESNQPCPTCRGTIEHITRSINFL